GLRGEVVGAAGGGGEGQGEGEGDPAELPDQGGRGDRGHGGTPERCSPAAGGSLAGVSAGRATGEHWRGAGRRSQDGRGPMGKEGRGYLGHESPESRLESYDVMVSLSWHLASVDPEAGSPGPPAPGPGPRRRRARPPRLWVLWSSASVNSL